MIPNDVAGRRAVICVVDADSEMIHDLRFGFAGKGLRRMDPSVSASYEHVIFLFFLGRIARISTHK
jgi:hypothetical protein